MATDTDEILFEVENYTAIITLNRPDRMNAITATMMDTFSERLVQCQKDPAIRVVIITGAGRGFCSGLDLQAQQQRLQDSEGDDGIAGRGYNLFDMRDGAPIVLHRMDKPTICALNGACAGYGMDLALICDIRIASEKGRMAAVFAKRNLIPESGGTWLLPRLLGWGKAAEVAFLGRVLDAQTCLQLGLVNTVVPHEDLLPEAKRWADEIAANAPMAIQATKRMMRFGENETFETSVDHLYVHVRPLFDMEDFREAMAAFTEKREPKFTGR